MSLVHPANLWLIQAGQDHAQEVQLKQTSEFVSPYLSPRWNVTSPLNYCSPSKKQMFIAVHRQSQEQYRHLQNLRNLFSSGQLYIKQLPLLL